jgi:RHS repeat-associated protein
VAVPAWKQVSKTEINPTAGRFTVTPYDLNSNAVTVESSVPVGNTVTKTVSSGLTGETITTTIQNGLPTGVSGTSGGVDITINNIQHTAGHMTSVSGTLGGAPVGKTIGADRRVSSVTGLEGTMNLNYSKPGGGFRVDGTINGTTSANAVDSYVEPSVLDISGQVPALNATTVDAASGAGETATITIPGEGGSLVVEKNIFGAVTRKKYAGTAIDETVTYHEDGTPHEITITGTAGAGSSITETTTWPTLYERQTGYTGSLTIKDNFYKTGARKSVEQVSATMPEKREFTYQRDVPRTEKHTAGIWSGVTVTFNQDSSGRLQQIVVAGAGLNRTFGLGYDDRSRLDETSMTTGTGTYFALNDYYAGHGQRKTTLSGTVETTRNYSTAGLLQGIVHSVTGGANINYGYPNRDAKLRITSRTSSFGHGWTGMSYDARGQLQSVNVANVRNYLYSHNGRGNRNGPASVATFFPNSLDQTAGKTLADGTRGFGVMGGVEPGADILLEAQNWLFPNWMEIMEDPVTGLFFQFWGVPNSYQGGIAFRAATKIRATKLENGMPIASAETDVYSLVPPVTESVQYDKQGRIFQDAYWVYQWDARNRLTRMVHKSPMPEPTVGSVIMDFSYDADGRRVQRKVTKGINGTGGFRVETSKVLWAGWLPIMEERRKQEPGQLEALIGRRWFQWGPDAGGALGAAGGIGGLMAIHEEDVSGAIGRTLVPVEDGLGNIVALINAATGARVATYEYGPFGEWIGGSGETDASPFRWQSKWFDAESEHYYFGYRNYCPRWGRWLSRDPMGEEGGFNLYAYCGNDPVNRADPLGLESLNHTTPVENAPSIVTEGLRAGRYGLRWLMSMDIVSEAKKYGGVNLEYDIKFESLNVVEITEKQMRGWKKTARDQLKAQGIKSGTPAFNAGYGRIINNYRNEWIASLRNVDVFIMDGESGKGKLYAFNPNGWDKSGARLVGVSGKDAGNLIAKLVLAGKSSGAAVAAEAAGMSAAAAKRFGASASVVKWVGRPLVVVGITKDAYEIYQANFGPRTVTSVAVGWTAAWAGAKGASWVGVRGGASLALAAGQSGPQVATPEEAVTVPLFSAIGGIVFGIGGAVGGYYYGREITETVWDWTFSK